MRILFVPAHKVRIHASGGHSIGNETKQRCKAALQEWKKGGIDYVLVSGGIFQFDQTIPAAQIMKDWFIEHGIPGPSILIEDRSKDTLENIDFSVRILRRRGLSSASILVISEARHTARIAILFRDYGIDVDIKKLVYRISPIRMIVEAITYIATAILGISLLSAAIRIYRGWRAR